MQLTTHGKCTYLLANIFLKNIFYSNGSEEITGPSRQIVLRAKTVFAMSCFNFTPVCKIGKVYLFCKNEGLLIEKDNTSVSQFTVHIRPVLHLILSLQTRRSCRIVSYFGDHFPPESNIYAPTSSRFSLVNGKCLASHCMLLYRKKKKYCSVYPLFLSLERTKKNINYVKCLSDVWIM